jgi:hypothetical protein
MPGQDLGLPGPHGASQPGQLRDLDAIAPAVKAIQRGPRVSQVAGGVDRAQQLLALPGRGDLTGRIPSRQTGPQPHPSPPGELLGRGDQEPADAVQRIALAAPMPR